MNFDQIKYLEKDNKLEIDIFVEKTAKIAFIFFVIVGGIIALIPIIILIASIIYKFDLGFGFVFPIIIAALVSFFLYKMAFWNMYGIEKYTIEKDSVIFTADYKIFKDKVMKLESKGIKVGLFDKKQNLEKKQLTAKLIFVLNEKQIQSTIDLSIDSIEKLIAKIEKKL